MFRRGKKDEGTNVERKKGRERDAGERKTEGTRQTMNEVAVGRFLRSSRESGRISGATEEEEDPRFPYSVGRSGKVVFPQPATI